jgi:hypothetical protein
MAGKLTNAGEYHLLDTYLKGTTRGTFYVGLYTDATEPAEDATLGTITELPVTNGYARIALVNGSWTVLGDLGTYIQTTFTASGGDWTNVTGWFLCTVASGIFGPLICVESFSDGARTILNGLTLKVTPTFLAA